MLPDKTIGGFTEIMTPEDRKHPNLDTNTETSASSSGVPDSPNIHTPKPLQPSGLKALRASLETEDVSRKLATLPKICKPGRQTWFQTHPNEELWIPYHLFTPEGEMGVIYLVAPHIAGILGELAPRHRMVPTINLEGGVNFWHLKIPERSNTWSDSALEIAGAAQSAWRRMVPNMGVRAYDAYAMNAPKPPPTWPSPDEIHTLLERAVGGRIITSEDHPEISKLF